MELKLKIAAVAALACLAGAGSVQARPYLMLSADDTGFQALDLGDIHVDGDMAQVTVIVAPLAGAPYSDKLAPLVKQKVQVACEENRWRLVSSDYTDAHEVLLARDENSQPWTTFGKADVKSLVQNAACRKLYSQNLVSRFLNVGEILAGYQAAHAKAAPEPKTQQQQLAERYKAGH